VGIQVKGFKPGDTVYAMPEFPRGGTYAEYLAIDAAQVALMPRTVSFSVAASMPMTALAAWTALEAADIQPGQNVLVHGGAGGVGSLAIQLAKAKGAHVTTTVSADNGELVKSLGADIVIDYKTTDFSTQVRDMDVVLDTVGGATQESSWGVLKRGGILLAFTQPPAAERADALGVRASFVFTAPRGDALAKIARLVDAGTLKPLICHEYTLAQAALVHDRGQSANLVGRTVLRVSN
jgi:NADPH:quinone reductase-like Zn-dependent oxidoreductase